MDSAPATWGGIVARNYVSVLNAPRAALTVMIPARRGITVNVVSPATVDTPLLQQILAPEQIQRREKANPMGRIGQPEDIAAAVAFFASPRAAYVTGQVLSVNGGIARIG